MVRVLIAEDPAALLAGTRRARIRRRTASNRGEKPSRVGVASFGQAEVQVGNHGA